MVIKFEGDKKKQHFEVRCKFNLHQHKIKKWDFIYIRIKDLLKFNPQVKIWKDNLYDILF